MAENEMDETKAQPEPQRTYGEREEVAGMRPCMKRPIAVHAKQIKTPFRVDSIEGDYKQGKAGDYLMRGIDGELYICDRAIFERSYDFKAAGALAG